MTPAISRRADSLRFKLMPIQEEINNSDATDQNQSTCRLRGERDFTPAVGPHPVTLPSQVGQDADALEVRDRR
jgi:hypothetical protein